MFSLKKIPLKAFPGMRLLLSSSFVYSVFENIDQLEMADKTTAASEQYNLIPETDTLISKPIRV